MLFMLLVLVNYNNPDGISASGLRYCYSFPVAQMVEHGTSNAKIMGSIPRESKSW